MKVPSALPNSTSPLLLKARWFFAALSLLAGAALVAVICRLTVADSTVLPFWDHWEFFIELASHAGHYTFSQLWEQHNEHRILLPKLLMLLDIHLFGGRGTFLLASILALQAIHALLFFPVVRSLEIDRAAQAALFGLSVALLFSPIQLDNFVWGFQITFILATFCNTAALYLLARAVGPIPSGTKPRRNLFLICSIVAAVCATLSLASGMFVWPLMILMALMSRGTWRPIMSILVTALIMNGLYLHKYHAVSKHGSVLDAFRHPGPLLQYVSLYIGGAWINFGQPFAMSVGTLGLILAVVVLVVGAARYRSLNWAEIFLLYLTALILISAFITGLGRLSLGITQAVSSRYQTVALLLWVAISILPVNWLKVQLRSSTASWIALVFLVALIWSPLADYKAIISPYAARAGQWRVAEAAIMSGVADSEMEQMVMPDPSQLPEPVEFLKTNHFSVFSGPLVNELGSALTSYYVIEPKSNCDGSVESSKLISDGNRSGLRIYGWTWEHQAHSPSERIVIADAADHIIGFGASRYPAPDAALVDGKAAARLAGWFAYVPLVHGPNAFRAYGVEGGDGRHICEIDSESGQRARSVLGLFRAGRWEREPDTSALGNSTVDLFTIFGQGGDIPLTGDWDGSGNRRIGVFRHGQWWLDMNGDFKWDPNFDKTASFGQKGDIPVVGDWDGTGKLRIGVFRNGQWWMDMNGNLKWDVGDKTVVLGQAGDLPVVGDWDGTGKFRIGVFRNGQWWLDMNGDMKWEGGVDKLVIMGQAGDIPVIGDWSGTKRYRIGVFRNGQWWLDMNGDLKWEGGTDKLVNFGEKGDIPIVGNWSSTGK